MIEWSRRNKAIRCVYVAVTHYTYSDIIPPLLEAGIHVLKEKQAARSINELPNLQSIGAKSKSGFYPDAKGVLGTNVRA